MSRACYFFFFSSRRRHTRLVSDWSSDVCSSDLDSLKLPPILASVAAAEAGMILVTGVTGSGKSSTMAAMVNHINQSQNKHIVTLENPIEFLHRDINCSVTQREIGVDTDDFRAGLRAAMRQD